MTQSVSAPQKIWRQGKEIKKNHSWHGTYLISLFLILVVIGLANLYSAAVDPSYFHAQLKHAIIGIVLFLICGWLIPLRFINTYSYWAYGAVCISLVIVLLIGHSAGGSQRWISFGGLRFQPSEIAKIGMAMMVAKWFHTHNYPKAYRLRDLWSLIATSIVVFGLIFLQPDLGTAGICLIIAMVQILFVRIDKRTTAIVASVGAASAALGWNFFLHPYQKLRILNLLNPDLDPSGSGYNSLQSLIAIGSGKLFGKGYLQGTQTQLQFLPARHTDFIFSVFAEEQGFWGGLFIFAIFGLLTYIALEIGRRAKDTFSSLFAVGLAAFIFVEFTINIAMVLGMFPVVGMPLPFFSYGGSSLLTLSIAIGLLIAIERNTLGRSTGEKKLQKPGIY